MIAEKRDGGNFRRPYGNPCFKGSIQAYIAEPVAISDRRRWLHPQ